MTWSDRFLRWELILALIALAAPFVAGFGLGMVYLWQIGALIPFALGSTGVILVASGLRWWVRRRVRQSAQTLPELPPDPGWSASESQAYAAAQQVIARDLTEPLSIEALRPVIEDMVAQIAAASGRGGKGLWEFSVPEGLLLVTRVSERMRAVMRDILPLADSVTVGQLLWLWRNREGLQTAGTAAQWGWLALRAVANPVAAGVSVLERPLTAALTDALSQEAQLRLQRRLLDEIARAAIDLYSGRLRYSASELADAPDRVPDAPPDRPIRIAVAGQVSAGKSTLINALAGGDLTEVDILPTTPDLRCYAARIAGQEVALMDMPGLDGGASSQTARLAELGEADLVLWVLRANSPARATDRQALEAWQSQIAARPELRAPVVLPVVTAVDRILPGWPFAEHDLPAPALATLADLGAAVSEDLPPGLPAPRCVSAAEPAWNIAQLTQDISEATPAALQVQRNRLRLAADQGQVAREFRRAGQGIKAAADLIRRG